MVANAKKWLDPSRVSDKEHAQWITRKLEVSVVLAVLETKQ
jgi:hypothetical protein